MGIDHLKVTFWHGQIHRLTNRAARMMQARVHIGQFHEIAKIFDCGVAALAIQITHERRAIDRREDGIIAANLHRTIVVAGILGELRRRSGTKAAAHAAGEMHPFALNISARVLQDRQRFGIILKIDADFFKDGFGVVFNNLRAFIG